MVLSLECNACGFVWSLPMSISGATFSGNAMNISAPCPRCGDNSDRAAEDGQYVSDSSGRLHRVASHLAGLDRFAAQELLAEIASIADRTDQKAALQTAEALGWAPTGADPQRSKLSSGNEALDFLIKLQIVIALLITGAEWSRETVQQLLEHWVW